jgi:hypothetical protein
MPYAMKQMGHTSAALTLSVYQRPWPDEDRPRLVGEEAPGGAGRRREAPGGAEDPSPAAVT